MATESSGLQPAVHRGVGTSTGSSWLAAATPSDHPRRARSCRLQRPRRCGAHLRVQGSRLLSRATRPHRWRQHLRTRDRQRSGHARRRLRHRRQPPPTVGGAQGHCGNASRELLDDSRRGTGRRAPVRRGERRGPAGVPAASRRRPGSLRRPSTASGRSAGRHHRKPALPSAGRREPDRLPTLDRPRRRHHGHLHRRHPHRGRRRHRRHRIPAQPPVIVRRHRFHRATRRQQHHAVRIHLPPGPTGTGLRRAVGAARSVPGGVRTAGPLSRLRVGRRHPAADTAATGRGTPGLPGRQSPPGDPSAAGHGHPLRSTGRLRPGRHHRRRAEGRPGAQRRHGHHLPPHRRRRAGRRRERHPS